ncbi:hypothetical protein [Oceanobacillus rekensis]|uniref:hypothetical protein n=1 Tax=Oceanobacillus rekensis TaxID=937927 RepID=UPI000B439E60|nr:hypothetical protein [Oceanobacillus rekensis]
MEIRDLFELENDTDFQKINQQVNSFNAKMHVELPVLDDTEIKVQDTFKKWMETKGISENHYRVSKRHLPFEILLFDAYKEKLGETREKWWWHNGPFLFWISINEGSLYFTLEVGPIEADKRVLLMEKLKEQGIMFHKKGLTIKAKYNRIHTETVSIEGLEEAALLDVFNGFYENEDLQGILGKLEVVYDEWDPYHK